MRGLILFAHGARDPRWAEPFERLRDVVRATAPDTPVALAYLELMQPDVAGAAQALIDAGCDALRIVPLFLGQGGHIRRDLPALVERLRESLPGVAIDVVAAAGEDADVIAALAAYALRG